MGGSVAVILASSVMQVSLWRSTLRSYELIARKVMPQFQSHAQATLDVARRTKEVRASLAAEQAQAVEGARVRYQAELAKRS